MAADPAVVQREHLVLTLTQEAADELLEPTVGHGGFQSAIRRVQDGSGLGLAIAKHLAEAQGGRVWAHNDVAAVTFGVALPLA